MPAPPESSAADVPRDRVELAVVADIAIVSVIGDYDISQGDELSAALVGVAQFACVLVDFTRCTLLDSTGIAVLLKAQTQARGTGGRVRLVVPHDGAVARVVHLTRLGDLMPISQSLDDALELARPD